MQYATRYVQPGLDYFKSKFCSDSLQLKNILNAFKAVRLFVPHRLIEMNADARAIDSLSALLFLNHQSTLSSLKLELPTSLALSQDVAADYDTLS